MPSLGRTDESAGREKNGPEAMRQTNAQKEPSPDPQQPLKRKVTKCARPCPQTVRRPNDTANASTKSGAGDFPRRSKRSYIPRKVLGTPIARGISNTPTRLYRPIISERGPDILTEHTVSERRIDTNPVVYGIRLSDEQLRKIGEGEYIRLENMKREDGTLFSGYVVMDDRFRASWIFRQPPDRIVKEDKFYIREMDKLLADHGYVVRAKVRFWGPTQPKSRQYFWKDKYGLYDCSYDDPRLLKPPRQEIRVPSVPPPKEVEGA